MALTFFDLTAEVKKKGGILSTAVDSVQRGPKVAVWYF